MLYKLTVFEVNAIEFCSVTASFFSKGILLAENHSDQKIFDGSAKF